MLIPSVTFTSKGELNSGCCKPIACWDCVRHVCQRSKLDPASCEFAGWQILCPSFTWSSCELAGWTAHTHEMACKASSSLKNYSHRRLPAQQNDLSAQKINDSGQYWLRLRAKTCWRSWGCDERCSAKPGHFITASYQELCLTVTIARK